MTKKIRFIKKLPFLAEAEKEKAAAFFSKYPVYESCIDWNNKLLTYRDFEAVFIKANNSKTSIIGKAKRNPEILFKKYNCRVIFKTERFLVIMPLDWECAVFLNSFKCGGSGAKWCIGDKESFLLWNSYIKSGDLFYLVFFPENHYVWGKKILLQYIKKKDKFITWLQEDKKENGIAPLYEKICRDDLINVTLY